MSPGNLSAEDSLSYVEKSFNLGGQVQHSKKLLDLSATGNWDSNLDQHTNQTNDVECEAIFDLHSKVFGSELDCERSCYNGEYDENLK